MSSAYSLVENAFTVGTVLIESLIDYIPSVTLALVVGHNLLDVVLHHSCEGGICPGTARYFYMSALHKMD